MLRACANSRLAPFRTWQPPLAIQEDDHGDRLFTACLICCTERHSYASNHRISRLVNSRPSQSCTCSRGNLNGSAGRPTWPANVVQAQAKLAFRTITTVSAERLL